MAASITKESMVGNNTTQSSDNMKPENQCLAANAWPSSDEEAASDVLQPPAASMTTIQTVVLMIALCLCVFLAALDVTVITTALPTISAHFQSTAGYNWVGAAYTLAEAAATPKIVIYQRTMRLLGLGWTLKKCESGFSWQRKVIKDW